MQRVPPDVAYLHAVKSIKDTQADRVISPALSTNGRSVIATRTFLDSASTTGCVRLAPTHPVTSPLHTTNSVRSPPSVFGIPPDGHPAFGETPFENAQAALLVSARVAGCACVLFSHKRNLIRLSSSLYLWCVLV